MHQAASPNAATLASGHPLSSCLAGSWVHAWEENTPGPTVYRLAEYPFGPSRGREGYEFQAGGILIFHGFGPADGSLTSIGSWVWVTEDQVHITVNDPQGAYIDKTPRMVSCDADVLHVEQVTHPGRSSIDAPRSSTRAAPSRAKVPRFPQMATGTECPPHA